MPPLIAMNPPPDLATINHSHVSADSHLPAVSLPDGSKIQTGMIGALLHNIKAYDRVVGGNAKPGVKLPPSLLDCMCVLMT